ncbi:MAG: PAS domain S-box protein [Acidobacteriia bacterium]|nr:PAS domain S-box protein [Terriglobia bacterium]
MGSARLDPRLVLEAVAAVLAFVAGGLGLVPWLASQVRKRRRAEEALEQARYEMEARIATRTADLAERSRLAALTAEIGMVLARGDAVDVTLQRAAEIVLRCVEGAFARIWTLNQAGDVLELHASAGMYTHLDGGHGRVPVGKFKIGRIAQEGQPHLTNNVQEDSWVGNKEWARREAMVAFAGYPLMVEDRVVGVVGAFARQRITVAGFQAFELLAGSIAQFLARKRVEVALLESEEKTRLLLDSAAEAIYGMDLDGRCTLANRACLELLGYEKQKDLLGRNMHDLMHHTRPGGGAYPIAECRIFQAVRRGEGSHADDEVLWRADGTSFPAEYWSYPVRKSGQIVGAVVTFLDISARKRAEEEQHKLVALVETSSDFIVIASPERKILYLNQGGAKMAGIESPRQAIGMDISAFHSESAWKRIENEVIPAVMKAGHHEEEAQLRNLKTGALVDVLLNAFLLRKPETGEIICLAAVMRDITLRKRAEAALRTSEEVSGSPPRMPAT